MKNIVFIIVKKQAIPFSFSIAQMRKYPVPEHYLYEMQEITVLYSYDPSQLKSPELEQKYIAMIATKLKAKYNAYSVQIGSLEPQIQKQ